MRCCMAPRVPQSEISPQTRASESRAALARIVPGCKALGIAAGQGHGVDRAGAGAAQALERDALVRQQRVEHAPGEGAVRAAALQSQIEGPHGGSRKQHSCGPLWMRPVSSRVGAVRRYTPSSLRGQRPRAGDPQGQNVLYFEVRRRGARVAKGGRL